MAAAAILNLKKNVNNSGLDILHKIIWEDAPRPRGDDRRRRRFWHATLTIA